MSAFENARKFFEACETPAGWEGCKEYVADGAPFNAQSEPLVDVTTMNNDDKVEKMVKVWNAPWAMKELGWM